jgi:hypothetical protein
VNLGMNLEQPYLPEAGPVSLRRQWTFARGPEAVLRVRNEYVIGAKAALSAGTANSTPRVGRIEGHSTH